MQLEQSVRRMVLRNSRVAKMDTTSKVRIVLQMTTRLQCYKIARRRASGSSAVNRVASKPLLIWGLMMITRISAPVLGQLILLVVSLLREKRCISTRPPQRIRATLLILTSASVARLLHPHMKRPLALATILQVHGLLVRE